MLGHDAVRVEERGDRDARDVRVERAGVVLVVGLCGELSVYAGHLVWRGARALEIKGALTYHFPITPYENRAGIIFVV